MEDASGKRSVDPLEEFEEDQADRVSVREKLIAPRARELGDEALGAQFRKVVAERGERELFGGTAKGLDHVWVDLGGGEGAAGGDVGEADEGVHQGELSGMVEFQARNASSGRGNGRLRQVAKLAAVDERFQDVLLNVEVVIGDF